MAVVRIYPNVRPLQEEVERIRALIAERAYELAAQRGYTPGRELDDWVTAEAQLVWKPELRLEEAPRDLVLKFRVPGVRATDLRIAAESDRLLVVGEARAETPAESVRIHGDEFRYGTVFREVWLPHPIEPTRARARLNDGLLVVTLPKRKTTSSPPRFARAPRGGTA